MTRYDYLRALEAAVKEFRDFVIEDFLAELVGEDLQQANDELMLCVYEHTQDRRAP